MHPAEFLRHHDMSQPQPLPFDSASAALAAAYDDAPLWSHDAARLLFDVVPMRGVRAALDLGCGTGWPALELAERLGPGTFTVGADRWPAGIARAGEKARVRGTQRAGLVEAEATRLPFATGAFDLAVSSLGLNNFEPLGEALAECRRVLRPGGALVVATNLRGTFTEFYGVYDIVLEELGLEAARRAVAATDQRRMTAPELCALLRGAGFHDPDAREETVTWRFADGSAFLDHWFIRLGFLPSWIDPLPEAGRGDILAALRVALDAVAMAAGGLRLSVPLAAVSARR